MPTEDQAAQIAADLNERVNAPWNYKDTEQGILGKVISTVDDKLDEVAAGPSSV